MKEFVVNGGVALSGEILVSGSKNAALPIIFASIITRGISRLDNVADIGDVRVALGIITELGARVVRSGSTVYIDTTSLEYKETSGDVLSKIRASTYLIGASLVRFGRCALHSPGGCNFSERPIDLHIYAAESLGARLCDGYILAPTLHAGQIRFRVASVGATANALIMASGIDGVTEIYNYAREPHITALSHFLISAGASIFFDDEKITVRGGNLGGGRIEIIGDMIEAGTYLAAGLITGGEVSVRGVDVRDMGAFLSFLRALGCETYSDCASVSAKRGAHFRAVNVVADPYPAFPTDLAPIAAPLIACLSRGSITDNVWRERFGYLDELYRFGLRFSRTGERADIYHSDLFATHVRAPDLRGGAACLLAALQAQGESVVLNADLILRGYENIDRKLRSLGADIKIRNSIT